MDPTTRIRFSWNPDLTRCRATAMDIEGRVLGELTVDMSPDTARRIWSRGGNMQFRVEDLAETQLRALLELGS